MDKAFSDFDVDLRRGLAGEDFVRAFGMGTIEVKRDDMFFQTGNLYIETQSRNSGVWVKSGICTTKAYWWCWVLGSAGVFLPVTALKDYLRENWSSLKNAHCGMEPNPTTGKLIKLNSLLDWVG